jgi:hypothetical protein
MMTVTIDTVTGNPPFNVWVANGCESSSPSIFINTITLSDIPYTFTLPAGYQNSGFCVKVIDIDNCEVCECFGIPSPSPTPTISLTPSETPTSTPTPTVTPSGICLTPTYFYGSFVGNGFSENATYTLSSTLVNGRPQWVSPNNGTILLNGARWEVSGWNLAGTIFYNLNFVTVGAPDIVNWVYQGCVKGFVCSVSFNTEGCGQPSSPTPEPTPTVSPTPESTPTVETTACLYTINESPSWVDTVNQLGNSTTMTINSLIVSGTEYITGVPPVLTLTTANVNWVTANNDFTRNGVTGVSYTNGVDFLNSLFTLYGITGIRAQIAYLNSVTDSYGNKLPSFYIVNDNGVQFTIDIGTPPGWIKRYTETGILDNTDGVFYPSGGYQVTMCSNYNVVNGIVME